MFHDAEASPECISIERDIPNEPCFSSILHPFVPLTHSMNHLLRANKGAYNRVKSKLFSYNALRYIYNAYCIQLCLLHSFFFFVISTHYHIGSLVSFQLNIKADGSCKCLLYVLSHTSTFFLFICLAC